MSRLRVLLRLDANQLVGEAHAVRSAALLAQTRIGAEVILVGAGDRLTTYFPGRKVVSCQPNDHGEFLRIFAELRPEIVWVDHPHTNGDFWRALRATQGGARFICIDDFGGEIDADLVINGTVLEEYHRYPLMRPPSRVCAGGEYALLRPVFADHPWRDPEEAAVTVVAGSGERARDWIMNVFSGAINLGGWGRVRAIVGRTFPHLDALQALCGARGASLSSGVSGEEMAAALSSSTVALITGGTIVYEAIAVGVPAVVFPNLDNLVPEAKWFADRSCIVNLGPEAGQDMNLVSRSLTDLLASAETRNLMSDRQKRVVDGRGLERAASVIRSLVQSR